METNENEHYITFPLDHNVHEGIQDHISHEEICEPVDECILQQDLSEVAVEDVSQNMTQTQVVEILAENSEDEEHSSIIYPIYIKEEVSKQFTSGDESMAVEALRQLGGMYPRFDDKKVACPNCDNIFTQVELSKHQDTCPFDKHTCNTCSEKFDRKMDLNNHLVCHQVDRPHSCRTCGNLFRTKASLQMHINEVHQIERPHVCTVCGADFQRPSSLSNHKKIHSYIAGRALMKDEGNNTITNIDNLKTILDTEQIPVLTTVHNIQNVEIPQIQWAAVQTYSFTNDQSNSNGIASQCEKMDTVQEFTVLPNGEVAQFEYSSQNTINKQIGQEYNLTLNNSEALVKIETTNVNNEGKKVIAEVQEKKGYSCSQCGVSFACAASLTLHEKTHSKDEWSVPVECEYCDKQFQDSNFLASHHMTCTKKLMQNNALSNSSNSKWGKHSCSECGKKFTTKQKMFRHQWIHRKKTHSCEVCGSQFERQSELDEHRLSAHPGDSPFTCNECGKSFVSRQGLWEHGRTHAGSPAYFHCDTCSKTFSSRQGYLIHHRTHTGERPYGCKFCWKAFRDGGTLRKHERIHTGERPHVCPLCTRAFNQKVVLREHVRWVHAAGKNETEVVEPPFPCPLCGTLNQDRDELCAHIVKHSDQMIAEAKAKTNNVAAKPKQQKRKNKTSEGKSKSMQTNLTERHITPSEQNEALLSITEQVDTLAKTQDTYLVVKSEYDDAVCIKTYTESSELTEINEQREPINVITIAKSCDIKDQEETVNVINRQANINTMHFIPFNMSGETIHFISTNKQNNTLRLISKQNENLPVLAIPNPECNERFVNQISQTENSESSLDITISDSPIPEEYQERIQGESIIIEPVSIEIENIEHAQIINQNESDDENEELVCGICGNNFDDKNVLVEHVKIHI